MLGFIWRLIIGRFYTCDHEWEEVYCAGIHKGQREVGELHGFKCRKCCKMKTEKVGL